MLKRFVCIILLMFIVASNVSNVNAQAFEGDNQACQINQDDSSILVNSFHMNDSLGNTNGPYPEDFETSKNKLLEEINDGEVNVSKNTYINNQEDAENGIFNVVLDVVGKPIENPVDVNFVLDVSGSMNMWTNNRSVSTVPDMNPEHYYRIPQGTFNATEDIFIKIRDYGKYSSWITLSTNSSWWGNLYNAHGLSGSHGNLEIYNWNPWDNLYKYENGEYIHLPMNATKTFESPVGNTDGSFDRMMVQMESALNLTKLTLEADPNNTVAVTTFAGSVVSDVNFTNDLSIIETVLANHDGHDNTRWGDGLNQALTNLNARVDTNKTSYVIFITDGLPTDGNNGLNKANQIKNETNAIIYSIGIQSNALDKLTPLATSPEHAYDAVDSTDFINYIDKITKDIIMQPKGTLVEVISDQFDFYIDDTHPFVIGDEVYTTFESIPDNLLDKQTFTLKHGTNRFRGQMN